MMAKGLFKALDYTMAGVTVEEDLASSYKLDDLVHVVDDSEEFGLEEGPPKFYVATLPGTKADYIPHLEPLFEPLKNKLPLASIKYPRLLGYIIGENMQFRRQIRIARFKLVGGVLKDKEVLGGL